MAIKELLVYVLTALAALVVLLTRLRLGRGASGRVATGGLMLAVHTIAGVVGLVIWVIFLVAPTRSANGGEWADLLGILGLLCLWLVVVAGMFILVRWLPSRGRHSGHAAADRWSRGPWLSIVAHVGMLVGVGYLTWAYAVSVV
ncbi:hypothetical protein AB3X52_08095 [Nocardioides sp. DS6]|uniref:DUF420 domain-containing protein n=1 Tax=Nocardioides eburneus TaxID=3231482 RepID=A0ABV3SYF1_9ACTN